MTIFAMQKESIHSMLAQGAHHQNEHTMLTRNRDITSSVLRRYLDIIFYRVWQSRTFYANLPDRLSRDEPLQQQCDKAQQ